MSTMELSGLTPEQKRALLARMLAQKGRGQQSFPLSHAQQRLWFIDCLQSGTNVYSIPVAVRLRGSLDPSRLRNCLDIIVARHESLRTRFVTREGEPVQVIDPPAQVSLVEEDLPAGASALEGRLQALVDQPFDLARGPLIRFRLFRVAADDHVLAMVVHHIVADYWSLQVLIGELSSLYGSSGDPSQATLRVLPIQYPDYAAWQQQRAGELAAQLDYWRAQLADAPHLLQLPTDFPRPAMQSFDGARHVFRLDKDVSSALGQLARARGMTPFMVLLAAFQLLLHRYSGSDDICVGSTVSNRDRAELRDLIGLFVNNLVLRTRFDSHDTFETLLARVRATTLDAFANQEVPFEQVVDALDVKRDLGHNALFQAMFVLHNTETSRFNVPGLDLSTIEFGNRSARFDISLDMYEGDTYNGVLEYNTDLFRPATIARFAGHFATLLRQLVTNPGGRLGSIDLLNANEHAELKRRNRTAAAYPNVDVATLFEISAAERGEAEAIRCADRTLTYSALNAAANRLAAHMRRLLKNQQRPRIAICLPRSEEIVVAVLAVLKLGGSYIPLDPGHPADRLTHCLEDGNAALLLVRDAAGTVPALAANPPCALLDLATVNIDGEDESNPPRDVSLDDLAYVIFTSGSTGRPKGVPIRQDSLVNLLTSMALTPGMTSDDTFVAVTTPAFDIATLELLMPLLVGGRLVVAEAHSVYDDIELTRLLRDNKATLMQATPATWRILADAGWLAPAGFKILCGGEALDPLLAKRLLAGAGELWNLYGPTETTIWSACTRIRHEHAQGAIIPIGDPIANTQLHVLDRNLLPVPAGVAGELYIGGDGLSPGYLGRDDLTAAAFVANPFYAADPVANSPRLYRTGDEVRRLADGSLIYLGRLDFQVKLRGFRIELAEIEAALNTEPEIEQAVVVLWPNSDDGGELAAYCRPVAGCQPGLEARLRNALAGRLPSYMIPSAYVLVDSFPLNANGKVDRKRLPRPQLAAPSDSYMPPRTSTETLVAEIWSEILDIPRVGRDDDFFGLGGHSLLAARMIARLRPIFETAPPLRSLFERPTLRDFAASIDEVTQGAAPSVQAGGTIDRLPRGGPLPLSFAQQRQWALAQLEPESSFYNMPVAVRLKGEPDLDRLSRAFSLLCDRHEVLRSRFLSENGRAAVDIVPHVDITLDVSMVSSFALEEALLGEARLPFDLTEAPLLRVKLFSTEPGDHVLLVVLHHIVGDALSMDILVRDLTQIYRDLASGPAPSLPALPVQYADFAAWQRAQDTAGQLDYWRNTLHGAPPLLELPTDLPRPANQGFAGDSVRFTVDASLASGLRALSGSAGATPFMAVLATFANLLNRYSGMDDIVIGTPVAQRPHAAVEGLIGMFVNTLALRLRCSGDDTFDDLLARTRDTALDAFANQDVPFEQVVDGLSLPRNWSHNPLFQGMFVWQTQEKRPPVGLHDLEWERLTLPDRTSRVDLTLVVTDGDAGLSCKLEYRTDLFRRETIVAMSEALTTLLKAAVTRPTVRMAELSALHPSQRRLIRAWNATQKTYPEKPVGMHQLFEQKAAAVPDSIAITDRNGSISYGDLDRRANQLAVRLTEMGIGRASRVGISMKRSIDLVCAILAVLKTGAAYVPLDPRYPEDRIAFIAEDADLALILTQHGGALPASIASFDLDGFWNGDSGSTFAPAIQHPVDGEDLAYIIYTSGSTGRPKGVSLEHRSAVAFIHWCLDVFSPAQLSGMLASTSICFDLSIFEIFATLASGGRILMADDLFDLPNLPFANEVTLINTVPTPMTELVRLGALPASVKTVCLAGEALPPSLAAKIYAQGTVEAIYNLYGPSEDTTFSTCERLVDGEPFGIGSPITNTQAHVLDEALLEVPIGMPGELYLAGAGLARGYWQRPDITAERFLPNPFAEAGRPELMYRTGDRVRWLADGGLDYLGRGDRQMKIRGFRIEPGEVETALLRHPEISGAAVDLWRDAAGNARLVAWIEGAPAPAPETITAFLRESLPEHLVPTLFVGLKTLPRLPNGKLDRKALPDPNTTEMDSRATEPPYSGLEARIAAIWGGLLGRTDIGRNDNFFALGGDSILAIQAVAGAREQGIPLSPRQIFQHPSLATLAAALGDFPTERPARERVVGSVPLGPIQRWFLARDLPQPQHWNQGFVLKPTRVIDADLLEAAIAALAAQHDALRARFTSAPDGWQQRYLPLGDAPVLQRIDATTGDAQQILADAAASLQASFDLENGPLWGAILLDLGEAGQRLVLAAHHLIIDGVSWRILLGDLQGNYRALEAGRPLPDAIRSSGVGEWVNQLANADVFADEAGYWDDVCRSAVEPLPLDFLQGENLAAVSGVVEHTIDAATTTRLLQDVPQNYPVRINDLLLTALALTIREWTGQASLRVEMESHGRPDLFDEIDLSRTIGWLTALYPVLFETRPDADPGQQLLAVKDTLLRVPNDGVGYGVLRHLKDGGLSSVEPPAQLRFNYLGQTDSLFPEDALFVPGGESSGPTQAGENPRDVVLEINALVAAGQLHIRWTYGSRLHRRETVESLADRFAAHLERLIDHCLATDDAGYTPADFPQMDFEQDELEDLLRSL